MVKLAGKTVKTTDKMVKIIKIVKNVNIGNKGNKLGLSWAKLSSSWDSTLL